MSAFWEFGRAEQCPLLGVKQTLDGLSGMSAYDPKRTFEVSGVSYRAGLASPPPDRGTVPSRAEASLSRSDA